MSQLRYLARMVCLSALTCGAASLVMGPAPLSIYVILVGASAVAATEKED